MKAEQKPRIDEDHMLMSKVLRGAPALIEPEQGSGVAGCVDCAISYVTGEGGAVKDVKDKECNIVK